MADLVAFLCARLDEDETAIRSKRLEYNVRSRALRHVGAERAILELHEGPHECSSYDEMIGEDNNCAWIGDGRTCSTIRHLASVYSDHPDYQQEWKPGAAH